MDCWDFQRRADELAEQFMEQRRPKTVAEQVDAIELEALKVEARFVLRSMQERNAALVLDLDTNRWLVRYPEGGVLAFSVDSPDGKLLELIATAA